MGLSRPEYWSGLPFPSPGDLPDPGIKPGSPAFAGRFFTDWAMKEALIQGGPGQIYLGVLAFQGVKSCLRGVHRLTNLWSWNILHVRTLRMHLPEKKGKRNERINEVRNSTPLVVLSASRNVWDLLSASGRLPTSKGTWKMHFHLSPWSIRKTRPRDPGPCSNEGACTTILPPCGLESLQ